MSLVAHVATRCRYCALLLAALALTSGCMFRRGGPAEDGGGSSTDYASRFEAANVISNTAERDKALAAVTIDAAKGGDGETVKKCVAAFTNTAACDDSAYKAAVALSRNGDIADAKAVAEMISNSAKRDDALSAIAKGS